MKKAYPAIIHAEEGRYWAEFPDVEGCFCEGESLEEVVTEAEHVLGAFLCSLMDRGLPVPAASDAMYLKPDDGCVTIVVTDPLKYKKSTKSVKKTLSIPEWLDEEARRMKINYSAVLQQAIIAMLR